MDKYKNLNTTVRTTIFQKESLVDKLQFLIPPVYNGEDLSVFTVTLKYVDPNGNFHSEVLEKDAEMYKDYLRYALPVTTKLTDASGTLTLRLTLMNFTPGTEAKESSHSISDNTLFISDNEEQPDDSTVIVKKLDTNSTTLTVQRPNGFTDYVNFEDIEAFKAQIADLNREIAKMPTDLEIGEHENLHLVHDGEQIGEGVEILQPSQFDELDEVNDGIVDVDDIVEDSPVSISQFIEL
jgi:hypothetical protein